MEQPTTFSFALTQEQQATLLEILRTGNYRPVRLPYAIAAAETPACKIALYKSGKCVIQGKEAADFVQFILEPHVLKQAQFGYEDVLHPEGVAPHMGIDESGKGDFFGPLVVAAAYVDPPLAPKLRALHVRDSKLISSDDRVMDLGRDLRKVLGRRFAIVKIGPRAYNRLYARMRNVNALLAWAHARAIENLLEVVPQCPRAVADQFGHPRLIEKSLMKKGRRIELVQRHRAESDIAVAAASIIAREAFLRSLKDMVQQHETPMPKGASAAVREAATELVRRKGPAILLETAKCHFKTTDEALKAAGATREALGPEGRAVSRPTRWAGGKSESQDSSVSES